jgi:UDP-MurNAc hydroxylase
MRIRLISHASVLVETESGVVWTDPWVTGKAFNDSWTLLPASGFDQSILSKITHLWTSHEHPDHLNFPTLRSLPDYFKKKVVVLFQENGSRRIFESLQNLGFRTFTALPHRRFLNLGGGTRLYCYQAGTMDSCLAVSSGGKTIFNVNDAKLGGQDCRIVLRDLGSVDVVLNQFSMAVCHPPAEYRPFLARLQRQVLENLSANHHDLNAQVTIPFASLMYWSSLDNRHFNEFSNRPGDVSRFCESRGQQTAILYPGDAYDVGQPYDSRSALERYERLFARMAEFPFDEPVRVPLEKIEAAFQAVVVELRSKFPRILLRAVRPLCIRIPDLNLTVQVSIGRGRIDEVEGTREPDLSMYSQPLEFCFSKPWGVQTLAISGRYFLLKGRRNWRLHRAIFALNNAGVCLRPGQIFSRNNWSFMNRRLHGWQTYRDPIV